MSFSILLTHKYVSSGLIKEIITVLEINIDVPDVDVTMVDAVRLLQPETSVSTYTLEMLHYAYIDLVDIVDISNNDAIDIMNSLKTANGENTPVTTDKKITWHHDKDTYIQRFGDSDPYECTDDSSALPKLGLEADEFLGNTMADMYSKCSWLADAQSVFDGLLVQSVVSWNALISGYTMNGLAESASHYFEQMQSEKTVSLVEHFNRAGFVDQGLDEKALQCLEQMQADNVFLDAATCICVQLIRAKKYIIKLLKKVWSAVQ
ncbi:hypothetical protein L7F22_060657 [Adiantum nelumboides]|nr:hypothetical protein [Adiantum nelumboides]